MSEKFQMLRKTKILKNEDFILLRCYICPAYKCYNANLSWHFDIYEQVEKHRGQVNQSSTNISLDDTSGL